MKHLPPQALDIEEAVLGAAITSSLSSDIVAQMDSESFYSDKHRFIHEAIKFIRANSGKVDILTVKDELKKRDRLDFIGGVLKLSDLASRVATSANLEFHIELLNEKYSARKLIESFSQVTPDLYQSQDVPGAIDKVEKVIFDIMKRHTNRKARDMSLISLEWLERLEKLVATDGNIVGIPSGIHEIDRITFGFQEPELTIVGARPSMGKTDFGMNIAYNAAKAGYKTAFISYEMSDMQLFQRAVSLEMNEPKSTFSRGDQHRVLTEDGFTSPEIIRAVDTINKSGLELVDAGSGNFADLKYKCRELVLKGCELIVIDYLGLIGKDTSYGKSVNHALGEISRGLKMDVCKEMSVPVIALHQLNRSCETRGGDKRPILSDLRDSGEIEQDADRVIFLYRAEYYGFETDSEGNSTEGQIEYIFAKNREGKTGTAVGCYTPNTGKHWNKVQQDNNAPF